MSDTKSVPRAAKTFRDITKLSHDNVATDTFSMSLDERVVHFQDQDWGENRRQTIDIPRKIFDAFVDWYTTGKVPLGDRAARTPPKETANGR